MSDYYMCAEGEVYKAALPSGLQLASNTNVFYNFDLFTNKENVQDIKFNKKETTILDALEKNKSLSLDKINKLLRIKNSISYIEALRNKNAIRVEETVNKDFRYKQERFLILNEKIANDEELFKTFEKLKRASKQQEALVAFLEFSDYDEPTQPKLVKYTAFTKKYNITAAIIKALIKKRILVSEIKNISRLFEDISETKPINKLSDCQSVSYEQIVKSFKNKATVLLHGVNSSGKTEIFIHLIDQYINSGKQVLYLLPEIALTIKIVERLKSVFGDKVGVYHSRYSDAERIEVWKNIMGHDDNIQQYSIILGVRSAVFLPFTNLGLVIVDEEHELSYKQFDPAPRFQGRDAALMLAKMHNAKTLLASATPSIESYYNAKTNKFALVELNKPFFDVKLPKIVIADVKEFKRKKAMKSYFSPLLISGIQKSLDNKEQVILFQNRRGFSLYLECQECGWIPKCKYCDVSLTYHKYSQNLVCHYCGYSHSVVSKCKHCKSVQISTRGFGTQRVEEDLQILFPKSNIARLDMDTTKGKKQYTKIISDFENGLTDILVGTQMVSKGLDFDNVALVGILDANQMLNFPNFRAYERTFQLIMQFGGRAVRRDKQSSLIIQTVSADNPIIEFVKNNNFKAFYQSQIQERRVFKYPPFNRLIYITLKHKDKKFLHAVANKYAEWLGEKKGLTVLGPEEPFVSKVYNLYLQSVIVKMDKASFMKEYKEHILNVSERLSKQKGCKSIRIIFDADAYS